MTYTSFVWWLAYLGLACFSVWAGSCFARSHKFRLRMLWDWSVPVASAASPEFLSKSVATVGNNKCACPLLPTVECKLPLDLHVKAVRAFKARPEVN